MQSISGTTAATGPQATAPQPRLVRAAHEFEAQMMKELLAPLNRGSALTGIDGAEEDAGAGSAGALGEFASEALGRALSEGGGFGLATSILHRLSPSNARNGNTPVIGKVYGDTVIDGRA